MPVYVDSSALIKRAVDEAESDALESALTHYVAEGVVIVSSSLAWIEVSRALRSRLNDGSISEDGVRDAIDGSLSGISERLITGDVVALARRISPPVLRSLDAIHVATAVLLDADEVIAYDHRLIAACRHHGLATVSPGR